MKKILAVLVLLLALAAVVIFCWWNGLFIINERAAAKYTVQGVDVSAYQGEIDWPTLAAQGIDFAFIKATEGSSFVDRCFAYNYEQALNTDLRVGAYHFFSFDSAGKTQAENYIATVEKTENMLPPVVDFEFHGDKKKNPPEVETARRELNVLLEMLEDYYGAKPIIYATRVAYDRYLAGEYGDYDIWFRNILREPRLSDGADWTFWQYTDRERLKGYKGEEKFIDMNVFCSSEAEFAAYGK